MGGWATLSLVRSFTPALSLNALAMLFCVLLLGGLVSRLARDRNALFALLGAVLIGGTLVATFGLREYIEAFKTARSRAPHLLQLRQSGLSGGLPAAGAADHSGGIRLGARAHAAPAARARAGVSERLPAADRLPLRRGDAAGRAGRLAGARRLCGRTAPAGPRDRPRAWRSSPWERCSVSRRPCRAFGATCSVTDQQTGQVTQQSVAEAQGNSGAFRRWTWDGTVHMALANPLLGTGIGTYEVAYPRYAETAFTLHAHNGYLQWLAETGIPGGFFLLAALAASTAFATHTLRLQRIRTAEDVAEETSDNALFGDRSMLLAGLLAGVLAALLHNLFDSDFYLVGTALNFAAVIGLMVGLSRDLAPLGTQTPRPLGREMLGFTLLLACLPPMAQFGHAERSDPYRHGRGGDDGGDVERLRGLSGRRRRRSAGRRSAALYGAAAAESAPPRRGACRAPESRPDAPTGKALYRLGQLYARHRRHGQRDHRAGTRPAARTPQPADAPRLAKALLSAEQDRSGGSGLSSDHRAGDRCPMERCGRCRNWSRRSSPMRTPRWAISPPMPASGARRRRSTRVRIG